MCRFCIWLIVSILPVLGATQAYSPLPKGEMVPSLVLSIYQEDKEMKLAFREHTDKVILIDYWATTCSNCWTALPGLVELQEKFKNDLIILIVTAESISDVRKSIQKFERRNNRTEFISALKKLKLLTSDTILSSLFPFEVFPTHVWIGMDNKYFATAYAESANETTVNSLLKTRTANLEEIVFPSSKQDSVYFRLIQSNKESREYSYLYPYIEKGTGPNSTIDFKNEDSSGLWSFNAINTSLSALYQYAYKWWNPFKLGGALNHPRLIVNPELHSIFYPTERFRDVPASWFRKNLFCYGFKGLAKNSKEFGRKMAADLDKRFNLISKIDTLEVFAWVIRTNKNFNVNRGDNDCKYTRTILDSVTYFNCFPVNGLQDQVRSIISRIEMQPLLVDSTELQGVINFSLPDILSYKFVTIEKLKSHLSSQGFFLNRERVRIPMLYIYSNKDESRSN